MIDVLIVGFLSAIGAVLGYYVAKDLDNYSSITKTDVNFDN